MDSEIKTIYESSDFVVVFKPAGVTVHRIKHFEEAKEKKGESDGIEEVYLTDWLIKNYPELKEVGDDPEFRPGIVHRLDKETSGALIVPRTQEAFEYFKKLFQEKGVQKTYLALVYGIVKDDFGLINKPIGLKAGTIKRTVHGGKMVREAITEYKVKKRFDDFTLLEVYPATGRTHQIRVHLASIGYPIVGDKLYGGKKEKKSLLTAGRQFLHAYTLEFEDQSGKAHKIKANLPDDLERIIKELS